MRETFSDAIVQLAQANEKVLLLSGDHGYGLFNSLRVKKPNQFINMGVAEQNMINVATGLTLSNYPVIVYSIVNFATFRCLEQIRNNNL